MSPVDEALHPGRRRPSRRGSASQPAGLGPQQSTTVVVSPPLPADKRPANLPTSFEYGIALHMGPLRATYNAELDAFQFFGAGVAPAAAAVDATCAREVSATEAFNDACNKPVPECAVVPRRLEDESTIFVIAHDGEAAAKRDSRTNANEASVATALSAKAGTVVRKRVAVLALHLLAPPGYDAAKHAREPPLPNFAQLMETITDVAKECRAEIACVHGMRVVLLFNGLVPVSAPARWAAHADAALRLALPDRRMVSVIAQGFAHVAPMSGGVLAIGDAVNRAQQLLQEAVGRKEHALERTALVDAATAVELRQSCELQCVGPINVGGGTDDVEMKSRLAYFVERLWDDDDDADDEWLYRLQKLESQSPFAELNAAFDAFCAGQRGIAVDLRGSASVTKFDAFALAQLSILLSDIDRGCITDTPTLPTLPA